MFTWQVLSLAEPYPPAQTEIIHFTKNCGLNSKYIKRNLVCRWTSQSQCHKALWLPQVFSLPWFPFPGTATAPHPPIIQAPLISLHATSLLATPHMQADPNDLQISAMASRFLHLTMYNTMTPQKHPFCPSQVLFIFSGFLEHPELFPNLYFIIRCSVSHAWLPLAHNLKCNLSHVIDALLTAGLM